MATIAELLIKLGMDDGGLDKGMSSSQSKLKSWGESLRNIGTKLTAGVTLPLVGAGLAAINWASDLDESLNKSEVLFGDSATDIRFWSVNAANSMGFSQQAALDMASSYAGMLNTVATTDTELAGMSTTLTQLTSDFASFHNLNPAEAFTVIQSALAGETEAIRRYGVDVSAAAVEQEALAMGLAATASELTEQDKLLARYNILLKQTGEEQGDFARTSKSTSNQMKIFRARLQDVGAELGAKLLPHFNRLLAIGLDVLDWLDRLDPKWQNVILAVAAFAAVLGPALIALGFMLPALGALATVIGFLLSPIGLLVIAIAALIGLGIYAFINDLWGVRDAVYAVIDALSVFNPVLTDLIDIFQAAREGDWAEVFDELKDAFISLGQALLELNEIVVEALGNLFGQLVDWVMGYDWGSLLASVGQAISDGLMAGLQSLSDAAFPVLQEWANGVIVVLTTLKDMAVQEVQGMALGIVMYFSLLASDVKSYVDTIQNSVSAAFTLAKTTAVTLVNELASAVGSKFIDLWNSVKGTALLIKNSVTTEFTNAKTSATTLTNELATAVGVKFIDLWNSVKGTALLIKNAIVTEFENAKTGVATAMTGIQNNVVSTLIGMVGSAYSMARAVGTAIGDGIKSGIDSMIGAVTSAAQALLDAAMGILSNVPGFSPIEHVGDYYGSKLGQGFAEGIASANRMVDAASGSLVDAAIRPLDAGVTGSGAYGAGSAGQQPIIVIQTVDPNYWQRLLTDVDDAVTFARGFGPGLALYGGNP